MDEYISIEKIVTALIVAVPTAWLSAYLSIKKYRTEKWWDKKLSFYLDTISALNNLILYCDSVLDIKCDGMSYSNDQIKSLEAKFHDARLHLQAQVNLGSIMYNKEAYKALFDLNNSLFPIERKNGLVQRAAGIRELADECIGIVTKNAQKDLGV